MKILQKLQTKIYKFLSVISRTRFFKNPTLIKKKTNNSAEEKLLFHFHCFYPELILELSDLLKNMTVPYKLAVTTESAEKKTEIENLLKNYSNPYEIFVTENKGRDIYPFIYVFQKYHAEYKYFIHTHSKKSPTVEFGDDWRIYLNHNLFGTKEIFNKNFELLSKHNVGFLAPSPYTRIQKDVFLKKQDKNAIYDFFDFLGIENYKKIQGLGNFPAGNFFMAKTDAIKSLLNKPCEEYYFPKEENQLYNTLQHTIERCWKYLTENAGFVYYQAKY